MRIHRDARRRLIAGLFTLLLGPGQPLGAAADGAAPATRIAGLLAEAERALAEDRLTVPSGRNAVGYAQEVLDLDPGNPEAPRILRAVVARYGLIAGAALDRAEAFRQRELARAETYRSRGEGVVRRFKLSAAPLDPVVERLDAAGAVPADARAMQQRRPLAHRVLHRLVGEYLRKSDAALERDRVAEGRRYFDLAAQLARDHAVSDPALAGIERRVAGAERDRATSEARAGSAKPGGLVKAVFLPPSF